MSTSTINQSIDQQPVISTLAAQLREARSALYRQQVQPVSKGRNDAIHDLRKDIFALELLMTRLIKTGQTWRHERTKQHVIITKIKGVKISYKFLGGDQEIFIISSTFIRFFTQVEVKQ